MLQGYGPLLLKGLAMTIGVSLAAFAVAFVLGLLGASAKLYGGRVLRTIAEIYTVVIRGVPELVLILLIYYGTPTLIQTLVRTFGPESMSRFRVDFDPFIAGVCTLGLIYGAFATEVFRGAIRSIPKGQIEAGIAYGMTGFTLIRMVIFPQMLRFAISGLGNVWLVLVKATALISAIQLDELMRSAELASANTREPFTFYLIAALLYLSVTVVSLALIKRTEQFAFRGNEARG
ncbi:ABC transporter permease [Paracoccus sp. S1E-3]|uniref:ABC transporter permease n=1 Tax=Paracoccus sp. S1E-3 TaxID=2756130 RepID=UPI0015EF595C|nr:ABC transporter permease [Paracoccus sp. S1E-3]MBA4491484.1 ABC transporter permease [Paracoccus sp. S1E-3]